MADIKTINELNEGGTSGAYNFNTLVQGVDGVELLRQNAGNLHVGITANYFDAINNYIVGDCVIYEGKLYQCTKDVTAGASFDTDYWTQIVITQFVRKKRTITLSASGWDANTMTQSVSVDCVKSSNDVTVYPAPTSVVEYSNNMVYCSAQTDGSLTFTCLTIPSVDLTVYAKIEG